MYITLLSSLSSSPAASSRRKKKVEQNLNEEKSGSVSEWKSEAQQKIYSSKLLRALSQARLSSARVKEAANRVLAAAARGRWRWSRAILTNRIKLKKNMGKRRQRQVMREERRRRKSKARLLGRLVPGCRKQPLPVVLEEVINYIPAALEMQVRGMRAVAELLSVAEQYRPN